MVTGGTEYKEDKPLTLYKNENGEHIVYAVCGGDDWTSDWIIWKDGTKAPTYTVEEVDIPTG